MSVGNKKRIELPGLSGANVTPLADVTTTLIVVFLISMPTIMWRGIDVKATEGEGGDQVLSQHVDPRKRDDLLTITVQPDGITLNRAQITFTNLGELLRKELDRRDDKTVVVVPSDHVELGRVVHVLDVCKQSGAGALALLNMDESRPRRSR